MTETPIFKPPSQDEITLYCFMGEAVCMIQELESALSCSITIQKHSTATKEEADVALNKHRKHYTLGKAVKLAEKENLLPLPLQDALNNFYHKRNWLIHEAMFESIEYRSDETSMKQLLHKIKSITSDAMTIKHAIEMDMLKFSESKGKDMSKVRKAMEEHDKK
jgi:hypothetical protein